MSKRMELELDILGTVFTLDVEYIIVSYGRYVEYTTTSNGTTDSWYGPGDSPELYIDQVINKNTGEDMTEWLERHYDWLGISRKPTVHYLKSNNKLFWDAHTYLEVLENKLYDLEEFDEGGDLGGYD